MNLENPSDINTNKTSIIESGFFGSSINNIKIIENFIEEKELKKLLDFAKNIKYWDETQIKYDKENNIIYEPDYWKDRVCTIANIDKQDPSVIILIGKMIDRIKPHIELAFNVEVEPTHPAIVRWLPGQFQNPHADKELHDKDNVGKPNDFPHYDISSLFYLNDDYEGGELYFPNQNIKIKPVPGAAYFFPGDRNYIHGVTKIISGIRYVIPLFWTVKKINIRTN